MGIWVYFKLEPNLASNERPDGLEPSKLKDATRLHVVLIIFHFSMGLHSQDHSGLTIFYHSSYRGQKREKKKEKKGKLIGGMWMYFGSGICSYDLH